MKFEASIGEDLAGFESVRVLGNLDTSEVTQWTQEDPQHWRCDNKQFVAIAEDVLQALEQHWKRDREKHDLAQHQPKTTHARPSLAERKAAAIKRESRQR